MVIKNSLIDVFNNVPDKKFWESSWNDFVIKQTPPDWFPLRKRKIWWCAHYSLKAVIEWKKWNTHDIEHYSSGWRSRNTYLMTPRWIIKVLKKNNMKYSILKAKKMDEHEKLSLLKDNLKKWPIILLVANWQTKSNRFNLRRALVHWHYVTLWGYNDSQQIFYVYDSNTKRKTLDTKMKWTLKIPYKYILKEWWIWATKLIYNYAIAVKY